MKKLVKMLNINKPLSFDLNLTGKNEIEIEGKNSKTLNINKLW